MVPRNGNKGGRREKKKSKETRAHLETMDMRTKPEANKWLHLTPPMGVKLHLTLIGRGCFRARPSDNQENPCLLSERGKPGQEC